VGDKVQFVGYEGMQNPSLKAKMTKVGTVMKAETGYYRVVIKWDQDNKKMAITGPSTWFKKEEQPQALKPTSRIAHRGLYPM
jgi:hypothetical protein